MSATRLNFGCAHDTQDVGVLLPSGYFMLFCCDLTNELYKFPTARTRNVHLLFDMRKVCVLRPQSLPGGHVGLLWTCWRFQQYLMNVPVAVEGQ